jgi:hypothetical protein
MQNEAMANTTAHRAMQIAPLPQMTLNGVCHPTPDDSPWRPTRTLLHANRRNAFKSCPCHRHMNSLCCGLHAIICVWARARGSAPGRRKCLDDQAGPGWQELTERSDR